MELARSRKERRLPFVALVRDYRFPTGGLERWTETVAQGLDRKGIRILYVTIAGFEDNRPGKCFTSTEGSLVIDVPQRENSEAQAREILAVLAKAASQHCWGFFPVLAYDYINIVGINLKGSPWNPIGVMHGPYLSPLEWFLACPGAHLICPSKYLTHTCRDFLRRRLGAFRTAGRVHYIPHGIPLPDRRVVGQNHSTDELRIVAATRLDHDTKRPLDYVEIAEALAARGVRFVLTILGDGPARGDVELAIRVKDLARQVTVRGAVSREKVFDEMRGSDVFISTSSAEAFGLSVVEAMACGCAVVAAECEGQLRELAEIGLIDVVPVGEAEAFAERIQEIRLSGDWSRTERARAYVERHLSDERMIESYARLLLTLAKRHLGPVATWRPIGLRTDPWVSDVANERAGGRLIRVIRRVLSALRRVIRF